MITYTVDPDEDLTVFNAKGFITVDELITHMKGFARDSRTRLTLWDFTEATYDTSSPLRDLTSLFRELLPYSENRRGGRSALLYSTPATYGIGRMGEILADLRSFPFDFKVFKDRAEAMSWLTSGRPEG